jgi:hypothetical protein
LIANAKWHAAKLKPMRLSEEPDDNRWTCERIDMIPSKRYDVNITVEVLPVAQWYKRT